MLLILYAISAFNLAGLGARVDNEYIRSLEADPEQEQHAPNQSPREVSSGHFVLVRPSPIRKPHLVAYSREVCHDILGMDLATCESDRHFLELFSGSHIEAHVPAFATSWATPYALSIYGQEIKPDGAGPRGYGYGDGRAISIGEVLIDATNESGSPQHWELQLKGSGRTPFCRGADGRAVLRSSLREFVASETMAALGVPTTRALALIASEGETVQRPWYKNQSTAIAIGAHRPVKHGGDLVRRERVAITTRVARSFLRTGQFELYGRRAARNEPDGRRQLEALARHALRREYPEQLVEDPTAPLQPQVLRMARAASARFAALAAHWIRVGYTQSNFNADNNLIGGITVDYGPFGFLERYEPSWGMWIGSGEHFSFMNQPQAAGRNFQMFARSLEPLLDAEGIAELRRIASSGYESNMREAMRDMWAAKLGLSTSAIHSIGAASVGSSRPSAAPQVATKAHEAAEALWKGLSALLGRTPTDWTLLWRQLADVADAAANGADDDAMVGLLEPAFYAPLEEEATAEQWRRWLRRWRAALQETRGGGAASLHEAADSMRRTNPKFVPREWMLVEAYTAAERGEYAPLHGLMAVLRTPYAEHPEAESRFYRRAPLGAEQQGGIGFMS